MDKSVKSITHVMGFYIKERQRYKGRAIHKVLNIPIGFPYFGILQDLRDETQLRELKMKMSNLANYLRK